MWCHERNRLRAVHAGLVLFIATGSVAAAEDATPSLKVSGKAALSVEARAAGESFEVRATLSDEVGRPLPNAEVRMRAESGGAATLHRCGDPRGEAGAELLLSTDKAGHVCISVTGMSTGSVELTFQDPRGYLEKTSRTLRLPDGITPTFDVGFDPPLSAVALDQPMQELGLVARAASGAASPEGAELTLSIAEDGAERELGRAALDGLGEVHRMSVVSATFGNPGPARLIARLRSRNGDELARATTPILRSATVQLHLSSAASAGIDPGTPLQVTATSALGAAPSGVVEARSRGISIAAARVRNGAATLTLPSTSNALVGGVLSLEYVGGGSGWLSGAPLEVKVLPAGPSYARYAAWFVAAALAGLAVVLGWRRPARPRPVEEPAPPRIRASVEVLEKFGSGGGYRGFVKDAHDGVPVSPAVINFLAPNRAVLLQARTASDGSFHVESSNFPRDTRVEVTAPFHATLVAPLPVPGVIELSLVSRRRALLERLVRWAERRGKPWTRLAGEPTPAHIVAVANAESEPQVERWARDVERLAFGAVPPDAASEQSVGDDPKARLD